MRKISKGAFRWSVLLALGLAWLVLRPTTTEPRATDAGVVSPPPHRVRAWPPNSRSNEVPVIRSLPAPLAAPDVSNEQDPLSIEELLDWHAELASKVVPLGDVREHLQQLVSDPENIAMARERMLEVPEDFSTEDEDERLALVRFFLSALRYEKNPSQEQVLSAMREVILAENHRQAEPKRLKRSIVGDKIQLVVALATHVPEEFKRLREEAAEHENRKLLKYAIAMATGSESPDE